MKTNTGVDIKEWFACKMPYPVTYLQTLVFDHLSMNFWFNWMPDKKHERFSLVSLSRNPLQNELDCTCKELNNHSN